jgi:predicted metalloprotease
VRTGAITVAVLVCLLLPTQWAALGPTGSSPVPARVRLVVAAPGVGGATKAERAAVAAVDGFWRRHFTELFGKPYRSPRVAGGYHGSGGPTCGGQPALPFNAFYCPAQDFLAWDENLMNAGYQRVGDAWIYLIVAHEWGHAIQFRLNRYLVSVAAELQAGDNQELGATLTSLSDTYPWTSQRDHGDGAQRIASFNLGGQRGVQACLAR